MDFSRLQIAVDTFLFSSQYTGINQDIVMFCSTHTHTPFSLFITSKYVGSHDIYASVTSTVMLLNNASFKPNDYDLKE